MTAAEVERLGARRRARDAAAASPSTLAAVVRVTAADQVRVPVRRAGLRPRRLSRPAAPRRADCRSNPWSALGRGRNASGGAAVGSASGRWSTSADVEHDQERACGEPGQQGDGAHDCQQRDRAAEANGHENGAKHNLRHGLHPIHRALGFADAPVQAHSHAAHRNATDPFASRADGDR